MLPERKRDVLLDAHRVEQGASLEEHRETAADGRELLLRQGHDGLAENRHVAFVRPRQAVDVPQRDALARPGRAEDTENLPAANLQVDPRQDVLAGIALPDVVELDNRLGLARGRRRSLGSGIRIRAHRL